MNTDADMVAAKEFGAPVRPAFNGRTFTLWVLVAVFAFFLPQQTFTGSSSVRMGGFPIGGVALDTDSNLYGTTSAGGAYGGGVVWEITPN